MPKVKIKSKVRDNKSAQKEYNDTYKKSLTNRKCFKIPLAKIVRKQSSIDIIDDAVLRMNEILFHTYQFLKLYCIYNYHYEEIPEINISLVMIIMKTIAYTNYDTNANANTKDKFKEIRENVRRFYDSCYLKCSGKINVSYTGLTQMITDQAVKIVTEYNNHIQEHFVDIVNTYVNIITKQKELLALCKKKKDRKNIINEIKQIKSDILNNTNTGNRVYVDIFNERILQNFHVVGTLKSMAENKQHRMKLLTLMIRMSIDGEMLVRHELSPEERGKKIKVINCFPLKSSLIPGYVDIDSALIIDLLIYRNPSFYRRRKWEKRYEIWNKFFKLEHSIFRKKGYIFDHRISTDGIGCSIHFIRKDLYVKEKKKKVKGKKKPKNFSMYRYCTDTTNDDREKIEKILKRKGKYPFVGIDPGKRDLIFCSNGEIEIKNKGIKEYRKAKIFRYSNGRRNQEIKKYYFQKKLRKIKRKIKYNNKTVEELESDLSEFNSSSCFSNNSVNYLKGKCKNIGSLSDFYKHKSHRKRKWYTKINKDRSEAEMLNRFEKTFGSPKDIIILMGDWSENKSMKNQEPSKGKSIRKLFSNRGYLLFLVDEWGTSKYHYETNDELVYFRKDEDNNYVHRVLTTDFVKKFSERKHIIESHPHPIIKDLVNTKNCCPIINRDLNGCLGIRSKGICGILGRVIHPNLSRKKI